ncbi:hypothetical protein Taro_046278, partial [Colocasia esculenta]|nr:hypothetical protein [Colocasia esculenta]
ASSFPSFGRRRGSEVGQAGLLSFISGARCRFLSLSFPVLCPQSTSPMAVFSTTCCSRLGGEVAAASCRPRALPLSVPSLHFLRRPCAWLPTWRITSAPVPAASSSPSFDFSPPPIDYDDGNLHDNLMVDGARDLATFTIGSFADDNMALDAACEGVVLYGSLIDHYHLPTVYQGGCHVKKLLVSGEDRVNFLHNQSTANFNSLSEGEGCDTVFVTPTARTIDLAHAWVMKNAITLLVSPLTCKTISDMLSRYIFFADKVEVNDITKRTCFLVLLGPKSNQVMEALKVDDLIGRPYGTHRHYKVNGMPVTVGVGSILSKDGFSFLMAPESA